MPPVTDSASSSAPWPAGGSRRSVTVTSLLGSAQVETALVCLATLLRYAAFPLRFRLLDDGTLTAEDRDRLSGALGAPEIIVRADADSRLAAYLSRWPATRIFREANPLALKLVDAAVFAGDRDLLFVDTDVLFLRPFSGLVPEPSDRPAGGGAPALFMADSQSAYSVRSWQVLRDRRLRLPARVNTGIMVVRPGVFDPELVEWFLARTEYHRTPVWAEQTCWALLAVRAGAELLDPRRVVVPRPGVALDGDVVAAHFVRSVRHRLGKTAAAAPDRTGEEPVILGRVPARPATAFTLLADELRRRSERILGR